MLPNSTFEAAAVLTVADTARLLGVSKFTLLRMRKRKDGLPFVRLSPGRIGYLRSDVHAYIAARRVGSLNPDEGYGDPRPGDAAGAIPYVQLGRCIFYQPEVVGDHVAATARTPTSDHRRPAP